MYQKIIIVLFAGVFAFKNSFGQENKLGSWNILNLKAELNNKWSIYSEFQLRSLSWYSRYYYYEWKAGLTYSVSGSFNITGGAGIYNTFEGGADYEKYSVEKEFRIWEQFVLDQKSGFVQIEHRARIEQRFKNEFASRFRYRLQASMPLNRKVIEPETLFTSVYDEIFFVDRSPVFNRNRSYGGVGYVFSESFSLQTGWLRQIDFYQDWKRRKNYFVVSVAYKF